MKRVQEIDAECCDRYWAFCSRMFLFCAHASRVRTLKCRTRSHLTALLVSNAQFCLLVIYINDKNATLVCKVLKFADVSVSEQFLNGTSAQYRLCSAILL